MKRLYDVLKDCKEDEEVKSEFCKFFKMKINALKAIDHYTETFLFEFKYDRSFKSAVNVAAAVAQKLGLAKYPLSPHICGVGQNEAYFIETKASAMFYASTAQKCERDRAASTPCPILPADIAVSELAARKSVHDALRAKLLTRVYEYGLLNPDTEMFE